LFGRTGHAESIARQVVAVSDMQNAGWKMDAATRSWPPWSSAVARASEVKASALH
jgi:hypothetical protein